MSATSHYIPSEYYVKFQRRGNQLLGFAIPFEENEHGETAKFKLNEETVDRWASMDVGLRIENELRQGFSIGHVITRWRTSNKVWRVEDPAGFELEIPSENLELLLTQCTLVKGVIQERCIWARATTGGYNWLLPEGTQLYEDAQAYAERRATKVSLRDLKRGDTVLMKDGDEMVYLGGLYQTSWEDDEEETYGYVTRRVHCTGHKRRYLFLKGTDIDDASATLTAMGSPHISGRLKEVGTELTADEVLALCQSRLHTMEHQYTPAKIKDGKLELVPVDAAALGRPEFHERKTEGYGKDQREVDTYYWGRWWGAPSMVIRDVDTDTYYAFGAALGRWRGCYMFAEHNSESTLVGTQLTGFDGSSNVLTRALEERQYQRGWQRYQTCYYTRTKEFTDRILNGELGGLEFFQLKLVGKKSEVLV